MISVAVFTFQRNHRLIQCLKSIDSSSVREILLFNDDEKKELELSSLSLSNELQRLIKIYNPVDFGFSGRAFRKPIYLNKAIELVQCNTILFSDDDGIFSPGSIDAHLDGLKENVFCAGSIIRDRLLHRKSKSILQGTNYSFQKQFYKDVGGYDEAFVQSQGGGDIDFWYRIYQHVQIYKLPVAFLPNACQDVTVHSERKKTKQEMDPQEYTLNKHKISQSGPMYKWFPEIRDKSMWMQIIND